MHNLMHFSEQWDKHRKQVRAAREAYLKQVERLKDYQDSEKGREDLLAAQQEYDTALQSIRGASLPRFQSILKDMEGKVEPESMEPPTPEMVNLLTMINMRDDISSEEIERATKTLQGNDAAVATLRDILQRKGKILPLEYKSAEQQKRQAVDTLRRSVSGLMAWDGRTEREVTSDAMLAKHNFRWGGGPMPTGHELDSKWVADVEVSTGYDSVVKKLTGASTAIVQALD